MARGTNAAITALLLAGASAACGHATGDFIWVDAVPKSLVAQSSETTIGPGDVISVRVFGQEANSVERARVRDDGKITIPFLSDVDVAGMEPAELARRVEVKLKPFIVKPVVTVVLHERPPMRISVVGNVARPGVYDVEDGLGVIHALAAAGGLTPFANEDRVFVLRPAFWADGNPSNGRIRFRYADVRRGKAPASQFRLRRGDVVVVE